MGLRDQPGVESKLNNTHVRSIAESNREEAAEPQPRANIHTHTASSNYRYRYSSIFCGIHIQSLGSLARCWPPWEVAHPLAHTHTPYDRYRLTWNVLRPLPFGAGFAYSTPCRAEESPATTKQQKQSTLHWRASSRNSLGTLQEEELLEHLCFENPLLINVMLCSLISLVNFICYVVVSVICPMLWKFSGTVAIFHRNF